MWMSSNAMKADDLSNCNLSEEKTTSTYGKSANDGPSGTDCTVSPGDRFPGADAGREREDRAASPDSLVTTNLKAYVDAILSEIRRDKSLSQGDRARRGGKCSISAVDSPAAQPADRRIRLHAPPAEPAATPPPFDEDLQAVSPGISLHRTGPDSAFYRTVIANLEPRISGPTDIVACDDRGCHLLYSGGVGIATHRRVNHYLRDWFVRLRETEPVLKSVSVLGLMKILRLTKHYKLGRVVVERQEDGHDEVEISENTLVNMIQSAAARDGPIDELRLLAGICSWINLNGVHLTDMIGDVEKLCRDIDDATIIRTFRINEAD
ncbi:hypothetical protein CPLU01_11783 [Colletotrichum plurivorum]|uniref:Uncharacterized protein n=1 Tax=Colletotrichum plurivorum TaxID=2175906 RepID=A0A8H6K1N1_9PEZI|nr:hypothetical protein CPLU01_11783 [Colletotrichum plurivorum]